MNLAHTTIAEGAAAYLAGLPLSANPYRGKGTPELAGGWTTGWNRYAATDPARANDPRPIGFTRAKRHAGHTGTKNRL
jgi:hypothetical protein